MELKLELAFPTENSTVNCQLSTPTTRMPHGSATNPVGVHAPHAEACTRIAKASSTARQRWTYGEFFDRCDRWSSALQRLGVKQGDRVAYIAPNTHAQLESFYAVPQLGAVLVPINFRLVADDFRYLIQHSGATVVCAGADHVAAVDSIRSDLKEVVHFVSLDGPGRERLARLRVAARRIRRRSFTRPPIGERDLLTINYTSGTTSRPKGVMITHRNAWMNCVGMLTHTPMTPADTYLWTLPMFHANGWTFTWTVTAAGAQAHLPAEVRRPRPCSGSRRRRR